MIDTKGISKSYQAMPFCKSTLSLFFIANKIQNNPIGNSKGNSKCIHTQIH